MKQLFFIAILACLVLVACEPEEQLQESVVSESKPSTPDTDIETDTTTNVENPTTVLLLDSIINLTNGEISTKSIHSHDEHGNTSESYSYIYSDNQLTQAYKYIYRDWEKSEFTVSRYCDHYTLNFGSNEYEFTKIQDLFQEIDSKGNTIVLEINDYTISNECTSEYKYSYTYNSYGDKTSFLYQGNDYISNTNLQYNYTYSYEYENNRPIVMIETIDFLYGDNASNSISKYIYSYDENGNKIKEERYYEATDENENKYWSPSSKYEYRYENNSVETITYVWDSSSTDWELSSKRIESSEKNGNIEINNIEIYDYNEENNTWGLYHTSTATYYYSEKIVKSDSPKSMMYIEQNHYNPHNIPAGHQPFDIEHKK